MGAGGDDLALTGEQSQVESVLVSPALSPMSLVREILNPPRLQQSAWDLGTPLKWAADPGSRAMPDGVDLRQRTVGMRLSKASPEKTQVAKVEEILCFAGGTPRRPHTSVREYGGGVTLVKRRRSVLRWSSHVRKKGMPSGPTLGSCGEGTRPQTLTPLGPSLDREVPPPPPLLHRCRLPPRLRSRSTPPLSAHYFNFCK